MLKIGSVLYILPFQEPAMNSLQARVVAVTLVALIPAALFILTRQSYIVLLSLVSTLVTAAAFYLMFTSIDREIEWAKPL
jgi:Ca2+/Na+ antiporter